MNADPFTGRSSYTSLGQNSSTNSAAFFPISAYKSFDVGDPSVILNKLKEFNARSGDGFNALSDTSLEEIVKLCSGPPGNPDAFDLLFKLLEWPDGKLFKYLIKNVCKANKSLC